ncbi:MAG: hypothetical protein ACQESN_09770 [Thermotogota bacterium]
MKNKILYLFIFSILFNISPAQNISDTTLDFSKFREKISLETDRNLYLNGEEICFSLRYLLNGTYQKGQLSNIVYIELLNDKYDPVIQKKYKIKNGNANGILTIPDNAYTGNYLLKAYTQYQRNLDIPNFCYNNITIVNPDIKPQHNVHSKKEDHIKILPEGGYFLDGVKTKTGVYLSDSLSKLTDSVLITNNDKQIIHKIHNPSNGLFCRDITLNDSVPYQLKIICSNNDTVRKKFPKPKKKGFVPRIDKKGFWINYSLYKMNINKDIKEKNYKLEVYTSDYRKIYEKTFHSFSTIKISENYLGYGLHYFILRNSKNNIVNINSFFSGHLDKSTDITTTKDTFDTREKVKLNLKTTTPKNKKFNASLSVVKKGTALKTMDFVPRNICLNPTLLENYIIDKNNLSETAKNQIKTGLLLYDEKINNKKFRSVFNKKKTKIEYVPEIEDITVSGTARNKKTKKGIANKKIYGSVLFNNEQLHINSTNNKGEFVLSLPYIKEDNKINLCPAFSSDNNNKNIELLINSKFSSNNQKFNISSLPIKEKNQDLIKELMINHQLNDFSNNEGKDSLKSTNNNDNRQQPSFFQYLTKTDLSDYVDIEDMETVLNDIVPNVFLKKQKGNYRIKISNDNGYSPPGKPLILLDNIPVFDINKIVKLHPSKIKSIKVCPKPYIIGKYSFNSVLLIESKTNNFANIKFSKNSIFLDYQGITTPAQFNKIDYSSANNTSRKNPDFRTTLYWNPNLKLNTESKRVTFYTSDRKGPYDIIFKGRNENGKLFYTKKSIVID